MQKQASCLLSLRAAAGSLSGGCRTMPSVYRQFNRDGVLLYIGTAGSLSARLQAHEMSTAWWRLVSRIDVEHYDDLGAAKDAEELAIANEAPMFNVQHRSKEKCGSDRRSVNGRKLGRSRKHKYSTDQANAILERYWSVPRLPMSDVAEFAASLLGADRVDDHWLKTLAIRYSGSARRTAPAGWRGIEVDADGRNVRYWKGQGDG